MLKINVSKTAAYPQPNWPKELKDAGFLGELDIITSGVIAVIIHPEAENEAIKASLKLALKQVDLQPNIKV